MKFAMSMLRLTSFIFITMVSVNETPISSVFAIAMAPLTIIFKWFLSAKHMPALSL